MARLRRLRSVSTWLAKALVGLVAVTLILFGLGVAGVESGWGKNRIRELIVRQANNYLTATLTIGRLDGSLFRGLQLGDISLTRNGRTLIHVDEIALAYSIRELIDQGVNTFVEVGPGRVLTGLLRQIDRSIHVFNVEDEKSLRSTLERLAQAQTESAEA